MTYYTGQNMSSKIQQKSEDTVAGPIFQQVSRRSWGGCSYLRKDFEGLKHHFKSVSYYSLMTALTALTQGEELLGKLCKERSSLGSFLRLKLEFSFQNKCMKK